MDFTTVKSGYLSIIASDFDARPMSFIQDGHRQGYEPAVARAVCGVLGLEPLWANLPMEDFYTALSSGNYDVIWFNQAITQERRAWADFTRPYGKFDEAVLVKEESPINEPKDLQGMRLGGLANSTNLEVVQQFPDLEIVPFPGSDKVLPEMLAALRSGEIDALVDDELVLMAAEADDTSLRLAFQLPSQHPFGVGVLPGNRELLKALNSALNSLILDGTLVKLWSQWILNKPFPF